MSTTSATTTTKQEAGQHPPGPGSTEPDPLLTSAQITTEVTKLMNPFGKLTDDLAELFSCVICLRPMEHPMATSCGHSFHSECLIDWLKKQNTCPVCRAIVTPRTIQEPLILRGAIEKYNELKPVVDGVHQYVTDLQRRVRAAQAALGTQAALSDTRKRDLDRAVQHTAELERTVAEQRAAREREKAAAEASLRSAEEKLESMQKQLVEERARLEEKARRAELERDDAERRAIAAAPSASVPAFHSPQPPPLQPTSSSSGFWKAVASIQSPLRFFLPGGSPPFDVGQSASRLPRIEEFRVMERRGCQAGCHVHRAIVKKSGASVALKRVVLCCPVPSPTSPASSLLQGQQQQQQQQPEFAPAEELSSQAVAQFSEAFILSNLKHECIVKLTGIVRETVPRGSPASFLLEMPFFEFDLDWAIREKRVGRMQAADVASQVLRALAYLHACGIAHRDVRPTSVLLRAPSTREPDPRDPCCPVVLAGFGQACSSSLGAAVPALRSLSRYHPPECFVYSEDPATLGIDWRSADVWSLGCVLGEILIGRPLFTADALRRLASGRDQQQQQQQPASLPPIMRFACASGFAGLSELFPGVPEQAVSLLQLLLARAPSRRPTASSALRNTFITPETHPQPPQLADSPQSHLQVTEEALRRFIRERCQGIFG